MKLPYLFALPVVLNGLASVSANPMPQVLPGPNLTPCPSGHSLYQGNCVVDENLYYVDPPEDIAVEGDDEYKKVADRFPKNGVHCPGTKAEGPFDFSHDFMVDNVLDFIPKGRIKGYPKKFDPQGQDAPDFVWQNDCGERQKNGETIMEIPMRVIDGKERRWKDVASNNRGAYREYYIYKRNEDGKEDVATYCAAYMHNKKTGGGFTACTDR